MSCFVFIRITGFLKNIPKRNGLVRKNLLAVYFDRRELWGHSKRLREKLSSIFTRGCGDNSLFFKVMNSNNVLLHFLPKYSA